MSNRTAMIVVLSSVIVVASSIMNMNAYTAPLKRTPVPKRLAERKAARVLNAQENIKNLLKDSTVDNITTLAQYRTYQKKINRLLRLLMKDYADVD